MSDNADDMRKKLEAFTPDTSQNQTWRADELDALSESCADQWERSPGAETAIEPASVEPYAARPNDASIKGGGPPKMSNFENIKDVGVWAAIGIAALFFGTMFKFYIDARFEASDKQFTHISDTLTRIESGIKSNSDKTESLKDAIDKRLDTLGGDIDTRFDALEKSNVKVQTTLEKNNDVQARLLDKLTK
jgi:hypothetical protein